MFLGFPVTKGAVGFAVGRIDSTWCIALHARGHHAIHISLFTDGDSVKPSDIPPIVDFANQALLKYAEGGPCTDCGEPHPPLTPKEVQAMADFCAGVFAKLETSVFIAYTNAKGKQDADTEK